MEEGTRPFVTVTGDPTVVEVPVQELPRKNTYVTLPPSWKPPVMMAESKTEDPTGIVVNDRVVVIPGLTFRTLNGSHTPAASLLFASPLYNAWKPKAPDGVGLTAEESGIIPLVTETVEMTTPETVHPASENSV